MQQEKHCYGNQASVDMESLVSVLLQNVDVLKDQDAVKQLASILKTNVRACKALGHPYVLQVSKYLTVTCMVYFPLFAVVHLCLMDRSGSHMLQPV
jgi:hypothetical protein